MAKHIAVFGQLNQWLLKPIAAGWLAVFRFLFGVVLAVSALRFIYNGWIDRLFVEPSFHFRYWGLSWVPVPGGNIIHGLFWAVLVLGVLVACGVLFRLSAALLLFCFAYIQLIDVTNYLNHYYLACLFALLLACSPAGRVWSVDNWLGLSKPEASIPAYWLWLLRFQVAVVYTFAGLAKANSDWLLHSQPLQIWLGSRTGLPLIGPLFTYEWAAPLMSWCGFLFDTTIIWFLLWRRTRLVAYLAVIFFHTVTRILFPIGMFPFIMLLGASLFFEPNWPNRAIAWLRGLRHLKSSSRVSREENTTKGQASSAPIHFHSITARPLFHKPLLALTALYCAFQLLFPLRHWLYQGNVLWDEQGMRFSWRVMVREKNGSITYIAKLPDGRVWHITPHRYLTKVQERELSGQPDLILQLGHHIGKDLERRGQGKPALYVDAWVSLNGRRLTRLIDPNVNLMEIRDGVGRADWVLPSPTTPPPRLRTLRAANISSSQRSPEAGRS